MSFNVCSSGFDWENMHGLSILKSMNFHTYANLHIAHIAVKEQLFYLYTV